MGEVGDDMAATSFSQSLGCQHAVGAVRESRACASRRLLESRVLRSSSYHLCRPGGTACLGRVIQGRRSQSFEGGVVNSR